MPTLRVLSSLRGYQFSWLAGDLIAGTMLAAIAVPEQLATAKLAGFPPAAGLVAFVCAGLAYALFGKNRFLSAGADSTIAPVFAGALASVAAPGEYALLAGAVALISGTLLIACGLARAGWIANLLSRPVTIGILAGISVHIAVGQLPSLLGVTAYPGHLPSQVVALVRDFPNANLVSLAIGIAVLATTALAGRVNERIPGALIGLTGAAIAFATLHLQSRGVAAVGALDTHLPAFALPIPRFEEALSILPLSLVIAAVCMMQTSAVVRAFPSERDVFEDVSGDFAAIGAGSVLAGLFGSFAVDASPPRTAVVESSGGRSQIATLVAVAAIVAIAAFFSGLAAFVPEAALAGVLLFIAMRIFRVADMIHIAQYSTREFELLLASAALVILLPIQEGMFFAIGLSLVHGIFLEMRPASTKLVREAGTSVWWPPSKATHGEEVPGVLVFAPAAPLNFTNASYIHEKLLDAIAAEKTPVKLLIIESSGITDVDYTGSQSAQQSIRELHERGIDVAMARLISVHAQARALRSGLIDVLGPHRLFQTVQEAVDTLWKS